MKVTPSQLHAVRYALGELIHHAFNGNSNEKTLRDLYIAGQLLELLKTLAKTAHTAKEKT